jgi:hypothetical protein
VRQLAEQEGMLPAEVVGDAQREVGERAHVGALVGGHGWRAQT